MRKFRQCRLGFRVVSTLQLAGFTSRSLLVVLCSSSRQKQARVSMWGLPGVGRRWRPRQGMNVDGVAVLGGLDVADNGGIHACRCGGWGRWSTGWRRGCRGRSRAKLDVAGGSGAASSWAARRLWLGGGHVQVLVTVVGSEQNTVRTQRRGGSAARRGRGRGRQTGSRFCCCSASWMFRASWWRFAA